MRTFRKAEVVREPDEGGVRELSLKLAQGGRHAPIDPNGAGKTMDAGDDVNAEIAENFARFHLLDLMSELIATLPCCKQRLLEIPVSIAAKPRGLLLDESAAGVPEGERHDILAAVGSLPRDTRQDMTEHDTNLVLSFADHILVLVNGTLLVEGETDEVARDSQEKAVYSGEASDA